MLMITLTHPSGRALRVNACAIAYIDVDPQHTIVAFSAGRQLVVTETAEEIEQLAAAARTPGLTIAEPVVEAPVAPAGATPAPTPKSKVKRG